MSNSVRLPGNIQLIVDQSTLAIFKLEMTIQSIVGFYGVDVAISSEFGWVEVEVEWNYDGQSGKNVTIEPLNEVRSQRRWKTGDLTVTAVPILFGKCSQRK